MNKRKLRKITFEYIFIFLFGILGAINYVLFVFPNSFAPAGINGIATMIQYKLNFSVGYMSLIINIPLFIAVFFFCNKDFACKNIVYVLSFSIMLLLFEKVIDISKFAYGPQLVATIEQDGEIIEIWSRISLILGPLAAGVVNGFILGYSIKMNSSTGGTDYIAKLIRLKYPEFNFVWITFILNTVVAISSYFIYGFNFEPVICCILYCFTTTMVSDFILKGSKSAIKFEVITESPTELSQAIITELRHDATVLSCEGMYTHSKKSLLICIINKRQIADFQELLERFPGTFAYMTSVNETVGNFRRDIRRSEMEAAKKGKIK